MSEQHQQEVLAKVLATQNPPPVTEKKEEGILPQENQTVLTPKVEEKPQTDYAKVFAAAARKEKQLREREESWKREQASVKPKLDEYEKLNTIFTQAKTKDPKAVKAALDILGVSAAEISEMTLREPTFNEDPQVVTLRQNFEKLQAELEELKGFKNKKELEEKTREERELETQYLSVLKDKVGSLLKEQAEKFDLCQCLGDEIYDQVLEIGDKHMTENDGELLSLDKILEIIENKEEQRIAKFRTSKKFGGTASQSGNQDADKTGTTPPTLTNKSSTSSTPVELAGLTGDARLNAIIKKYQ